MANQHGYTRHGGSHTPLYRVWAAMITRCENPNSINYRYYGAKGVTVCTRWRNSFAAFLADVGERPSPRYTLERIDSHGIYEPGNVKWATYTEQMRNRPTHTKLSIQKARSIRALSARGLSSRAIAQQFGVTHNTVLAVIHNRIWKEHC